MDNQIDSIIYLPVSSDWQHKKCRLLGLSFIHDNNIKSKDLVRIGISQAPSVTFRMKGDGTGFF